MATHVHTILGDGGLENLILGLEWIEGRCVNGFIESASRRSWAGVSRWMGAFTHVLPDTALDLYAHHDGRLWVGRGGSTDDRSGAFCGCSEGDRVAGVRDDNAERLLKRILGGLVSEPGSFRGHANSKTRSSTSRGSGSACCFRSVNHVPWDHLGAEDPLARRAPVIRALLRPPIAPSFPLICAATPIWFEIR